MTTSDSAKADGDAIEALELCIQLINSAHDSDTLHAQRKLIHAIRVFGESRLDLKCEAGHRAPLARAIKSLSLLATKYDASLDWCISYLEQLKARVEMIRRLSKELLK